MSIEQKEVQYVKLLGVNNIQEKELAISSRPNSDQKLLWFRVCVCHGHPTCQRLIPLNLKGLSVKNLKPGMLTDSLFAFLQVCQVLMLLKRSFVCLLLVKHWQTTEINLANESVIVRWLN